ncbi:hypothetical protein IWQ62_003795 [Dispira parvispora]|uniref:MoaB/Mog domain-containing protein n=1 Tax=Dispira parvispora TaxID=1520584 RepID=A0A9W8AU59_9FUNG|nr:hypothetical protein IWQ62_003795 [Dispira parvispora]
MNSYKVGILVVSDSVSRGRSTDQSVGELTKLLKTDAPDSVWRLSTSQVVPDEKEAIQRVIANWTYAEDPTNPLDLILTTGGTGLSPRDVTPEAVAPLLHKPCPGFTTAMLNASLAITPMATLSRPVSGIRSRSLIITLPGKPKAAVENLNAVLTSIPHALDLLRGHDSRQLHRQLDSPAPFRALGHTCRHGHHHDRSSETSNKDDNHHDLPLPLRPRESPYPMIPVQAAKQLISQHLPQLSTEKIPVNADLVGRVIAQNLTAPVPVPAYRASIVDGYAVHTKDGPGTYPLTTVPSVAGSLVNATPHLEPGHIMRISTGAPVPHGADAVVMVEYTSLVTSTADHHEETTVRIDYTSQPGENIREVGSDIPVGHPVLSSGQVISSLGAELGLLGSLGITQVSVYRQPVVGVFSTGCELITTSADTTGPLPPGKIHDSNRPALIAVLQNHGFKVVDLGIVSDERRDLVQFFQTHTQVSSPVDVLVSTGGVSMGEKDLLKSVLTDDLRATIHFGRVFMKPGKPTVFSTLETGSSADDDHDCRRRVIFSLPGNPVSALVTCHLFVIPALRRMAHLPNPEFPTVMAKLQHSITLDTRPEYHRAIVLSYTDHDQNSSTPGLTVSHPAPLLAYSATADQRSSRLLSFVHCNGLLVLPAKSNEQAVLQPGCDIQVILLESLVDAGHHFTTG